jgi:hypothetical protein
MGQKNFEIIVGEIYKMRGTSHNGPVYASPLRPLCGFSPAQFCDCRNCFANPLQPGCYAAMRGGSTA